MKEKDAKTCRVCRKKFKQTRFAQVVCSPLCAIKDVKLQRDKKRKAQRQKDRIRLEELKTKPQLTKEAQKEFNHFIRLRDKDKPCRSCLRTNKEVEVGSGVGGFWDCGHFLSVGSHPELRFNENNAYKQCKKCNGGSGKYTAKNYTVAEAYKENLIKYVGQGLVDWLEGPHDLPNHTHDDLRAIRHKYREKAKDLRKQQP